MSRVLVVDDESIIRSFVADGLVDAGYEVVTANNGAVALDCAYRHTPDAVLLDLLMPVMDGWAFLRERDAQPELAAVPVVVFSAAGRDGVQLAAALRATAVLSKPIDLEVLSSVLAQVLRDRRRAERDASGQPGGSNARRHVGRCPICAQLIYAHIDEALEGNDRLRCIRIERRKHVMSHTAAELTVVPLRQRLLQLPIGRRRILSDWVYRELRHEWGDQDRRAVHSMDEALNSPTLHRLWHDTLTCGYPACQH